MANGTDDQGLSLSPDLQGYVTGQNQLFPPPAPPATLASTSGFDLAFGDSIATQQHNHGMWGGTGPQYNSKNPAPFDIWHTNAVGDPTSRVLDRANWLLDQNPDYFANKNVFLSANANSPNDTASFGRLLDTLKEARVGNVVVPGLGPGIHNQAVVNATIQRMVEQRGFTYFTPNMTRGWDSAQQIHPNYPPEMTNQAMAALAQARREAQPITPGGTVPVSEGPYGSANLRPGYQNAPSGFTVSDTPGSQEQRPIAGQQYASVPPEQTTAPAAPTQPGQPTSLIPAEWAQRPQMNFQTNPLAIVPPSPLNQPAPPYSAPVAATPGPVTAAPPAAPGGTTLPDVGVTAPAPLARGLPPVGTDTSHEIWRRAPGDPTPGTVVDPDKGQTVAGTNGIPVSVAKQFIRAREPGPQGYKAAWGLPEGLTGKEPVDEFGFPTAEAYKGAPVGQKLYGGQLASLPSHAAGMFQIEPDTWKRGVLGLRAEGVNVKDFSAQSQELVASWLLRHDGMQHWTGLTASGEPFNAQLAGEWNEYLKSGKMPTLKQPEGTIGAAYTVGGPYMSGDVVPGTNFAVGGRLAFAPPPQMFTGPTAPGGGGRPAGPAVAGTGQGPGPAPDPGPAIAAKTAAIQKSLRDNRGMNGYQMLALAAALARPTIHPLKYDPLAALPKGPPPGTGRMPIEANIQTMPVGRGIGGASLPYQVVSSSPPAIRRQ